MAFEAPKVSRRNAVVLSAVLPSDPSDNAGGRYVSSLIKALSNDLACLVIAPASLSSDRAKSNGGVPDHVLVPSRPARDGPTGRVLRFARLLMHPAGTAALSVEQLRQSQSALSAIQQADLVDLQWQEQGSLIPELRRMNPSAKIVCTFHDVLSQRFDRAGASANSILKKGRWKIAAIAARRQERDIMNRADAVIVLSEKDAALLPPGQAEVHVATPPLAEDLGIIDRSRVDAGLIVFVGFLARWENEDGLVWFLSDMWPEIRRRVPEARVKVAGTGIRPPLAEIADEAGAELLGFVPDLTELYASAALMIVPLRLGAGVKFKVVDALLAGVPVVATSVGSEGVGDDDWFAGLHDEEAPFIAAAVDVLENLQPALTRAASVRSEVAEKYGWEQFCRSVNEIYVRKFAEKRRGDH